MLIFMAHGTLHLSHLLELGRYQKPFELASPLQENIPSHKNAKPLLLGGGVNPGNTVLLKGHWETTVKSGSHGPVI